MFSFAVRRKDRDEPFAFEEVRPRRHVLFSRFVSGQSSIVVAAEEHTRIGRHKEKKAQRKRLVVFHPYQVANPEVVASKHPGRTPPDLGPTRRAHTPVTDQVRLAEFEKGIRLFRRTGRCVRLVRALLLLAYILLFKRDTFGSIHREQGVM
jgi:hypothetical protein